MPPSGGLLDSLGPLTTTGSTGSNNGTALIDKFIWNAVHSSPSTMTYYASVALMMEAILLGIIITNVWRYFMFFHDVDPYYVLGGITLGTCGSIVQMGLNTHQVRDLIDHAASDYASIVRPDAYATLGVTFLTAHFNAAATAFYSWRAWKLSGRKKIMIAPLAIGMVASYALAYPVLIYGIKMPEVNIANAVRLEDWLMTQAKLIKAWGCTSVGVDMCLCILLVWLFLQSKESMFHAERALLNRLLILVFETMIPPTVVMLVLVCWTSTTGNQLTDFWRVLVWVLPDLYFLSILHSLISRRTIKTMLDQRSISDGVKIVNGQSIASSAYKSRATAAEEGRGTFGLLSDIGSIKVEIDTLVVESGMPLPSPTSAASAPFTPRRPRRSDDIVPRASDEMSNAPGESSLGDSSPAPGSSKTSLTSVHSTSDHRRSKRKAAPPLGAF